MIWVGSIGNDIQNNLQCANVKLNRIKYIKIKDRPMFTKCCHIVPFVFIICKTILGFFWKCIKIWIKTILTDEQTYYDIDKRAGDRNRGKVERIEAFTSSIQFYKKELKFLNFYIPNPNPNPFLKKANISLIEVIIEFRKPYKYLIKSTSGNWKLVVPKQLC